MARTNIDLDDELVAKLMDHTGIKTKRALVDAALQAYYKKLAYQALLDSAGTIEWVGDLEEMRGGPNLYEDPPKGYFEDGTNEEAQPKAAA